MPGLRLAADEQVRVERALVLRVEITAQRGDQPGEVGWTAGAGVPLRADRQHMLVGGQPARDAGMHLERIDVEETGAVQLHAGQRAVVQLKLEDVAVDGARLQREQVAGKERHGDGGTGFAVGRVAGQVIVVRERLQVHRGADVAGDVHLALGDGVEHPAAGFGKLSIARGRRGVGHGGKHVHLAYRVTARLLLLAHGHVALVVDVVLRINAVIAKGQTERLLRRVLFEEFGVLTAQVQKAQREVAVARIPGDAVQAKQRQLDLLMAGDALHAALAEAGVNVVHQAKDNMKQLVHARGLVQRHGGLDEVTRAVELVALEQIRPAGNGVPDGEVGVQIAVRLLRTADERDDVPHARGKRLVRLNAQGIGGSLQPFGDVAVLKHHAVKLALLLAGSHAEVFNRMGLRRAGHLVAQDAFHIGNGDVGHELLAGGPEALRKDDLRKRNLGDCGSHCNPSMMWWSLPAVPIDVGNLLRKRRAGFGTAAAATDDVRTEGDVLRGHVVAVNAPAQQVDATACHRGDVVAHGTKRRGDGQNTLYIVKADDGHITRNGQPLAVKDADGKPGFQVAEDEDARDAVLTPGAQLRPDFVFA